MNVHAVITEVLAIALTAIFFINIFVGMTPNIAMRVATFVIFIFLAIYLIRSALRDSRQKELLADLNNNLERKVAEQTREVRQAYEVEKRARADLEKLNDSKNQFIMITQHHLRTPVTSINWQLESIRTGTYGAISSELTAAVSDAETATKRLTRIIDDFLNISAMKAGSSMLDLSERSLKPAVIDILDELKLDIAKKHIAVSYPQNDADWPTLHIDYDKMRDILLIILENAVRYNHDGGSIRIATRVDAGMFELAIANTGIGISADESAKIGSALFYRGMDARTVNPIGMGVGLSVVKAIIRGHHGTFAIESEGKNKGAKVVVRVPMV